MTREVGFQSPPAEDGYVTDAAQTVTFFDTTYREALSLTEEARNYLAGLKSNGAKSSVPADALLASCEAMRLTSRLTQVMAWLLVQKAVHAGELTRSEAQDPKYRLAGQDICSPADPAFEGELEPGLADLLARSHSLYQRVARLDSLYDE